MDGKNILNTAMDVSGAKKLPFTAPIMAFNYNLYQKAALVHFEPSQSNLIAATLLSAVHLTSNHFSRKGEKYLSETFNNSRVFGYVGYLAAYFLMSAAFVMLLPIQNLPQTETKQKPAQSICSTVNCNSPMVPSID